MTSSMLPRSVLLAVLVVACFGFGSSANPEEPVARYHPITEQARQIGTLHEQHRFKALDRRFINLGKLFHKVKNSDFVQGIKKHVTKGVEGVKKHVTTLSRR